MSADGFAALLHRSHRATMEFEAKHLDMEHADISLYPMHTTFRLETDSAKTPVFLKKVRLLLSLFIAAAVIPGCQKTEDEAVTQSPTPTSTSQSAASNSPGKTYNNYEPGTLIKFGMGGGAERFKQSGWSDTENGFTWTIGESAKLAFSIPSTSRVLTLRMRLTALLKPPQRTSQTVTLLANGQKIAEWQVENTADFTAAIPAGVVKDDGLLTLELKTPDPISPKALGMSGDSRLLGVCVSELAITPGS